jgi:CHAT domain-containing protein
MWTGLAAALACVVCTPATAAAETPADPEYEKAQEILRKGDVDKYVALGWLKKGQEALASDSEPTDQRGDFKRALLWSDLAANGVMDKPYADIPFHVLSEHARICGHAGRIEESKAALERLRQYTELDSIRKTYVQMLAIWGPLNRLRLLDGALDLELLNRVSPDLAAALAEVERSMDLLQAPEQGDQYRFEAFQRLNILWASTYAAGVLGSVASMTRTEAKGWRDNEGLLARRLLQRVWAVSDKMFGKVAATLHLNLYRFYQLFGNVAEILQSLSQARKLFAEARDHTGVALSDLAEADAILAPRSRVEAIGIVGGFPSGSINAKAFEPNLLPPPPGSFWERKKEQAWPLLERAEVVLRDTGCSRGLAAAYLRQGYLASRLRRFEEAATLIDKASSLYELAGDETGRLTAQFHVVGNQLRAGQCKEAELASAQLLDAVEKGAYRGLALSMGNALLALAEQELGRPAAPTQTSTAIRLSIMAIGLLQDRQAEAFHLVECVRVAARVGLQTLTRDLTTRALALLDELEKGAATTARPPDFKLLKTALLLSEAVCALLAESGGPEAVRAASAAIVSAKGTAVERSPLFSTLTRTLQAAYLHNRMFEKAASLADPKDEETLFSLAMQAGTWDKAVALAQKRADRSRQALSDSQAAVASGELTEPEVVDRWHAELARDVRALASALARLAWQKKRKQPNAVPTEFTRLRDAVEEWKEMKTGDAAWQAQPWELLGLMGQASAGQADPLAAWMFYSGALQAIQGRLQELTEIGQRMAYLAEVEPFLHSMVAFLVFHAGKDFEVAGQGTPTGAALSLSIAELTRNLASEKRLDGILEELFPLLAAEEVSALAMLESRLRNAQLAQARLEADPQASPEDLEAARAELATAGQTRAQAVAALARKYPAFAFAKGIAAPVATADVVAQAAAHKLVFLVYRFLGPESYAWLADAQGVKSYLLPDPPGVIQERARALASLVASRGDAKAVEEQARKLHLSLLGPLEADLPAEALVALVPDGALAGLPFDVLKGPKGTFLERNPHFVVPSLAAYLQLARTGDGGPVEPDLLIIADPTYEAGAQGQAATAAAGQKGPAGGPPPRRRQLGIQQDPLPLPVATQATAELLVERFGKRKASAVTGKLATEMYFRKAAVEHGVVHLAAPFSPDPVRPMAGGLVMAATDSADEDGFLQAWEVAGTALKSRLVVLAALRTGLGVGAEQELETGMLRALLATGATAVVATIVPVEERGAGAFFDEFYAGLERGEGAAVATRKAALKVKSQPALAHPAFWAGFVTYGLGGAGVFKK